MKNKIQIVFNTIFITIILFFGLNFALAIVWEIRTTLKLKNIKPYDDIVLKELNLSDQDGIKLYLETYIDRKFDYDQFTEHAENHGFANKFVNATPDLGRKTVSPKNCNQNIYFYGGSTTFGYNVTDYQTIPSYLGKLLISNKKNICVKNFGRASYFSFQENILFQKHILNNKIKEGDVVIFIDGINENGIRNSRNTTFLYEVQKSLKQKYWDMYKYTFRIFFNSLPINQFINKLKEKRYDQNRFENPDEINTKEVFQKNLLLRKGICKELNLNCFSFLQPFAKIHGNYFEQSLKGTPEGRILTIEEDEQLKKKYNTLKNVTNVINITNSFDESEKLSYIDSVHYSPSANEILANRIYNIIKEKFNEK